jgi:hypothetical protein
MTVLQLSLFLACAAATTLSTGFLAYWNFDGNVLINQANPGTFNGAAVNSISYVASKTGFGQALSLSNNPVSSGGNYVSIPGSVGGGLSQAGGSITISGWFFALTWGADSVGVIWQSELSSWRFQRDATNGTCPSVGCGMKYNGGSAQRHTDATVPLNTWNHFVAITDKTFSPGQNRL